MGYYRDEPMVRTLSLEAEVRPLARCHPVELRLDELVSIGEKAQAVATTEVGKVQAQVWERNLGTMTIEQAKFVARRREEAIRRKMLRTMQRAAAEGEAFTVNEMQA